MTTSLSKSLEGEIYLMVDEEMSYFLASHSGFESNAFILNRASLDLGIAVAAFITDERRDNDIWFGLCYFGSSLCLCYL